MLQRSVMARQRQHGDQLSSVSRGDVLQHLIMVAGAIRL